MQQSKFKIEKKTFDSMDVFYCTKQIGEFIRDIDGFYIFFPTDLDGIPYSNGGYTSVFLTGLVNELDKINKIWQENIDKFFLQNLFDK